MNKSEENNKYGSSGYKCPYCRGEEYESVKDYRTRKCLACEGIYRVGDRDETGIGIKLPTPLQAGTIDTLMEERDPRYERSDAEKVFKKYRKKILDKYPEHARLERESAKYALVWP